jgi:hypothetical protein
MTSSVGGVPLIASVWSDRNRKYFISTCGSTAHAEPQTRVRMAMTDFGAERVTRVIPIHCLGKTYFKYCDVVDCHNRSRQDTLNIEKKFEVKTWDMRVNSTLIGILVVDAYRLYCGAETVSTNGDKRLDGGGNVIKTQKDFVSRLTEELLVFGKLTRGECTHQSPASRSYGSPEPRMVVLPKTTPKKRKRTANVDEDPDELPAKRKMVRKQLRCKMCSRKATMRCSNCRLCFCSPFTARECITKHATVCKETSESFQGPSSVVPFQR